MMWSIPALLFLIAFFHRVAPGVMARDLMQSFGAPPVTRGSRPPVGARLGSPTAPPPVRAGGPAAGGGPAPRD